MGVRIPNSRGHTEAWESITPTPLVQPAWRKIRPIKQRNVNLTTDGLWAMPLNTGWVPVKACMLQDWENLVKYVPIHKHGDVCPNGVPPLEKGATMRTIRIQNNQWFPEHCSTLCVQFAASFAQKCDPPPQPIHF